MKEVEIKVLDIDADDIKKKLVDFGAEKIQDVLLTVDWFRLKGVQMGEDPWYLRVRSYSNGKTEVTWKAKSVHDSVSRSHKEINVIVDSHEAMRDLFEEIDLELYAHQEKKRESWKFENAQFDIDTYPNMPPFLEIEAESNEAIQNLLEKFQIQNLPLYHDGERTLIENKYALNWCEMRF